VIQVLLVEDDPDAVAARGSAHPELGRFIDMGTYTRIVGLAGPRAMDALTALGTGELAGLVTVERASWTAIDQARESTVFVAVCGLEPLAPLLVACGPGLPSMGGTLPSCDVDTLRASLAFAAGVGGLDGSIFAEPQIDAEAEAARLRERLRQLYGE
jgi:hypothetical protein